MTRESIEILKELGKDEAFINDLIGADSEEKMLDLFSEKGVEMSKVELIEIIDTLPEEGELSESNLDKVQGGLLTEAGALAVLGWGIPKLVAAVKCSRASNWGRKSGAKCTCGLHWQY